MDHEIEFDSATTTRDPLADGMGPTDLGMRVELDETDRFCETERRRCGLDKNTPMEIVMKAWLNKDLAEQQADMDLARLSGRGPPTPTEERSPTHLSPSSPPDAGTPTCAMPISRLGSGLTAPAHPTAVQFPPAPPELVPAPAFPEPPERRAAFWKQAGTTAPQRGSGSVVESFPRNVGPLGPSMSPQ